MNKQENSEASEIKFTQQEKSDLLTKWNRKRLEEISVPDTSDYAIRIKRKQVGITDKEMVDALKGAYDLGEKWLNLPENEQLPYKAWTEVMTPIETILKKLGEI